MNTAAIWEKLLELGLPFVFMGIAVAYLYKDKIKQETKLEKQNDELRVEVKELRTRVIENQEKRLIQDGQTMNVLEKVLDKNGSTTNIMREAFARMETNQREMMEDIREMKNRIT